MALQLAFAKRLLCKSCDCKEFERIKLIKISLRVPIIDIYCIEV